MRRAWPALGLLALAAFVPALPRSDPGPAEVRGTVRGPGGPLGGACVRYQGTGISALTDDCGRFRLPRTSHPARVTASREGFLIAGLPAGPSLAFRLEPLPARDNPDYEWVDPTPGQGDQRCGNCHGEIYREWAASAHARSATGRHFRNLYEGTDWEGAAGVGWGLLTDYPDGAGVCASCHAPALDEGSPAHFDLRLVEGVARHGVHCDYCHKVAGVSGREPGLTHGRYDQHLLRPEEGHQLFLGPLDDVDRGEDAYSPLYRRSRYCASCHEGVVFGVPVYTTYSEWRDSPAAREGLHCQDCHMAPTGRMANVAPGKGGIEREPTTLSSHRFLEVSLARMLDDCLRVRPRFDPGPAGTRASVTLDVVGVGHRVPTGFIDRHLLLVVEGRDASGKTVKPLSGPLLPPHAGPDLAGRPGEVFARFLHDEQGNGPLPFWGEVAGWLDNRLTPGRPRELSWDFPKTLAGLRVRVIHRRFWEEVARAKGWPEGETVVVDRLYPVSRGAR